MSRGPHRLSFAFVAALALHCGGRTDDASGFADGPSVARDAAASDATIVSYAECTTQEGFTPMLAECCAMGPGCFPLGVGGRLRCLKRVRECAEGCAQPARCEVRSITRSVDLCTEASFGELIAISVCVE